MAQDEGTTIQNEGTIYPWDDDDTKSKMPPAEEDEAQTPASAAAVATPAEEPPAPGAHAGPAPEESGEAVGVAPEPILQSPPTAPVVEPVRADEGSGGTILGEEAPPSPAPLGAAVAEAAVAPAADEDEEVSEDFFGAEDELFDRPGVQKMGIVGGKGVGKSYLFQAMVYRTYAGGKAGAMSYYLENDAIRLFAALDRKERARTVNLVTFIRRYVSWDRLPQTKVFDQKWYRLRLPYRTGAFGKRRSALDVEFFDGSGEGFFQAMRTAKNRAIWRDGYLDARVMVFCLPIWVAFPDSGLTEEDWLERRDVLEGFERTVQNFTDLRTLNKRTQPVCSILALTMADDRRSALKHLRDRWITSYLDSPQTFLQRLRRDGGVARYLANARKISEALHEEFAAVADPLVAAIPQKLDFYGGKPWLIPVSAIDGSFLEEIEQRFHKERPPTLPPPIPAHVELPLLVALCERENALM